MATQDDYVNMFDPDEAISSGRKEEKVFAETAFRRSRTMNPNTPQSQR